MRRSRWVVLVATVAVLFGAAGSGASVVLSEPVVRQAPAGSGLCDSGGTRQFVDVGDSDYGAAYILCMRALGLSQGRSDGGYGPDRELNRGQMASFLIRLWTDHLGGECPTGVVAPFTDTEGTTHEANIECLFGLGITQGTSDTTYSPQGELKASQISRFLYRTYQKAGGDRCGGTEGPELARASECLFNLRVVPSPDEATSAIPVKRAQMGVYVIGLWHNLTGRGLPPAPPQRPTTPIGHDTQVAEVYGRLLSDFMDRWSIPGGAFALARDGRLLYAGGYGIADKGTQRPVRPDSLFRIASISKPITAVAVLKLVEDGQLNLDDHAFDLLAPDAAAADPRLYDITVRQLLHHTAGWDSSDGFDPMFAPHLVAEYLGAPKPVSCAQTVQFMLARQLDFDPGERFAYSNFGYCVLGRIIEAVTGQSYEAYVTHRILGPVGITRMHIGSTLASAAADGEVRYYGYPDQPLAYTVISDNPETVPWPYGGFHLRAMAAHGGWVASVVDLARFAVSVDSSRPPALLSPATVETMLSAPDLRSGSDPSYHYGLGWVVWPVADEANWSHDGSLPGTSSLLVRTHHGMVWSVLLNSRPHDFSTFMGELDALMWRGLGEITDWPSHDLFEHYGYE